MTLAKKKVTLRVCNPRNDAMSFVLEPWGEIYEMPAGATFEVSGEGPEGDDFEVEAGDDYITVYAWPGATVELRDANGKELGAGSAPRQMVPPIPNEVS